MNEFADKSGSEEGLASGWGFWLIAAFLYALVAYTGWTGLGRYQLAQASQHFVQVEGVVANSGIKERGGGGGSRALVVVGYEVQGEPFTLQTNVARQLRKASGLK